MVINKNSWHYKVWLFSQSLWDDARFASETTSLCSYVKQIALLPFSLILWLFAMVVFCGGFGIVFVFETIWGLLTGYLPSGPTMFDHRPYDGWKVGGLELYPIHALLVLAIAVLIKTFTTTTLVVLIGLGTLFLAVAAMLAIAKCWNSDTVRLMRAWVSAKRQGVCPVITFKDK